MRQIGSRWVRWGWQFRLGNALSEHTATTASCNKMHLHNTDNDICVVTLRRLSRTCDPQGHTPHGIEGSAGLDGLVGLVGSNVLGLWWLEGPEG